MHLEGVHVLLGHPLQRRRFRPVPAQADLQEPVATAGAGLDEAAHRQPVPDQAAELNLTGSACASKWITETLPQPFARATPVTSGQVMV